MQSQFIKKLKLPDKPGVYFFKKGKSILYIGKATSLRSRIKSYFSKDILDTRGPLIQKMIAEFSKVDFIKTDSVLEALIVEAELIKKHQPYYNTREKDDKSFNYVCITSEDLPKVIIVRGKDLNPKNFYKVFGPYPSGTQLREAIKIIRRIFPFLDEKSRNYLEFYKQINLVPDLNDKKLYKQNIKNIILFFSGKKQQILRNLKKEMKNYAKMREFEKAGEIRRQMFSLQHINDVALLGKENITRSGTFRIEAYDIAHMGGKNMVGVMTVVENNEINKNEYKKFKIKTQMGANDTGALREILERRLAHKEWIYPDLIVVDGGIAQLHAGMLVLKKAGIKIPVVSVLKDERHKPKDILGGKEFGLKYKKEILLANSEAHRFAIAYHKKMRNKNFLKNFFK